MVKEITKLTKYLSKSFFEQENDLDSVLIDLLDLLQEQGYCKHAFLINNSKSKSYYPSNFKKDFHISDVFEAFVINNWGHLNILGPEHPEGNDFWEELCDFLALFFINIALNQKSEIITNLSSEIRKTLKPDLALEKLYFGLNDFAEIKNFYFFTKLFNIGEANEEVFRGYSLNFYNGQTSTLGKIPELEQILQLQEIENYLAKQTNSYSKIFKVKISATGREWGLIAISLTYPWTEDLERVFEIFAEQMATIFNQHELHNESLTMAQREFLLNQITTKIRESLVIQNIIETAVQEIAQVMSIESCGLIILDRKISGISNHKTWSIAEVYDQSMVETLYAILKSDLEPSWFKPTICLGDLSLSDQESAKRLQDIGVKSFIASGLFKDSTKELVGILVVACFSKYRNWTYDEQLLVEGAAKQLDMALIQAAIYQESQQTKRQMALLHKLSNDIRDSLDIAVVMGQIARGIGEVLGLSRCFVRRFSNRICKTEEEYTSNGYIKTADLIFDFEEEWIQDLLAKTLEKKSAEILHIPSVKIRFKEEPKLLKIIETISLKSYLAVPLIARGKLLGTINIHQCDRERLFLPEEVEFIFRVASEAAIALEHAELFETINKFNKMDPDTGLYNKRYFREVAESEIAKSKEIGKHISFMLVDVDYLKDINDDSEHGGHEAGDEAINILARVLSNTVRQTPVDEVHKRISDIVGRFGGDEFMVLLPNTNIGDALKVARRIADNLAKTKHSTWPKPLTCSIGIAGTPNDEYDYESFKTHADKALYLSKAKGRNAISSTLEL